MHIYIYISIYIYIYMYIRRPLLCRGTRLRYSGIVLLSEINKLSYHRSVDGVSRYAETDLQSVINGYWIRAPGPRNYPHDPIRTRAAADPYQIEAESSSNN
jgi:hypothetical protein